ncbi:5'-3' exonuclease [Nostocoides sp. HKS02]|uniref:5'-3' exonuclease n=1 Tax=Nostocoides sp. HKS02 TaxID=1813880 RepID=UPI0012B49D9A|nr:5'-3' exonuclease [Tetrasphaera sp. HKS02]QGN57296.1 flap endonuclease [Tetrasphaera sp. HKS02]
MSESLHGRLMLLDSASLYFRAFFGVPDQRDDLSEPPTNAIRGFLDMIASLITTHQPTHLVACWDNDWRPQFRVDAIPTYKAHRLLDGSLEEEQTPDDLAVQVPVIRDALAALGIARLGADGYEADDVIGTLTARHKGSMAVDVVTGDRDLFQLVDDAAAVRVIYTARGGVRDPDLVDEAFLRTKYAVASGPAYADMAVLRGDTSDGLPGVAGIGEKTAAKLIEKYGSLVALRAAVDGGDPEIKGAQRARLEAGAAYLDVAPMVVRVAPDAPVAEQDLTLPTEVADPVLMSRVASQFGVTSSFNRVLSALRIE